MKKKPGISKKEKELKKKTRVREDVNERKA